VVVLRKTAASAGNSAPQMGSNPSLRSPGLLWAHVGGGEGVFNPGTTFYAGFLFPSEISNKFLRTTKHTFDLKKPTNQMFSVNPCQ